MSIAHNILMHSVLKAELRDHFVKDLREKAPLEQLSDVAIICRSALRLKQSQPNGDRFFYEITVGVGQYSSESRNETSLSDVVQEALNTITLIRTTSTDSNTGPFYTHIHLTDILVELVDSKNKQGGTGKTSFVRIIDQFVKRVVGSDNTDVICGYAQMVSIVLKLAQNDQRCHVVVVPFEKILRDKISTLAIDTDRRNSQNFDTVMTGQSAASLIKFIGYLYRTRTIYTSDHIVELADNLLNSKDKKSIGNLIELLTITKNRLETSVNETIINEVEAIYSRIIRLKNSSRISPTARSSIDIFFVERQQKLEKSYRSVRPKLAHEKKNIKYSHYKY